MKKTLLVFLSVLLCLSSCVDKQKRFREITDEMNLNTSAVLFTTMSFISKMPTDDEYATKDMFSTLKENGVCGRVYSLIEKNEELFNEAADLNIDVDKLNHLKGINDCCKNVWKYIKEGNINYMGDISTQITNASEISAKVQDEFPKANSDKMMKIAFGILGNK